MQVRFYMCTFHIVMRSSNGTFTTPSGALYPSTPGIIYTLISLSNDNRPLHALFLHQD